MSSCKLGRLLSANYMAWGRLGWGLFCFAISVVVAHVAPYNAERLNSTANIAATVFSLLFGFSMTIVAVVGGLDSVLSKYSWEVLQRYKDTFGAKILRQCFLCLLYFVATLLSLVLVILAPNECAHKIVSRLFLFAVSFSFLLSFTMPFSLYGLYIERYTLLMKQKGAPQ